MAVSLVLRKYDGEVIERSELPYVPAPLVWESGGFPVLSGVDLNGDTIFNARQMRQVLAEVDQLLGVDGLTKDMRDSLEAVAELCRKGQRPPHRFLWFVGD